MPLMPASKSSAPRNPAAIGEAHLTVVRQRAAAVT
jgi:hypothetical protein